VPGSWLQLSLRAAPESLDTISNFLIERGSTGVVLTKNGIRAYFPAPEKGSSLKRDVQRFLDTVRELYPALRSERPRWTLLKDRNWNRSWRRFFLPQKIGSSFWVGPPWIDRPRSGRRKIITIEPGMAFGTGTHFTTRSCLEMIEAAVASLAPGKFQALDVGTGSGILAIGLALLGAKRVCALDTDPVALRVAKTNLRRNGVDRIIRLFNKGPEKIDERFDVVVANLTAETLIELSGPLQERVLPRGFMILSGIITAKAAQVRSCFGSFSVVRRLRQKEWTTFLLRKRD
jgi:ribosomal protein L11 methyltransferase